MKKEVKHVDPRLTGTRPRVGLAPGDKLYYPVAAKLCFLPLLFPYHPLSSSLSSLFLKNKRKKVIFFFF